MVFVLNKKEFHASKKHTVVDLVDIDKIVISDDMIKIMINIMIKVLDILFYLTILMITLLDLYALLYLKWVDS